MKVCYQLFFLPRLCTCFGASLTHKYALTLTWTHAHTQYYSYAMSVLFPECLIRLIMDFNQVDDFDVVGAIEYECSMVISLGPNPPSCRPRE